MKKITALFLAFLLCISPFQSVSAAKETSLKKTPSVTNLIQLVQDGYVKLLVDRRNYGYMQFSENMRSEITPQYLMETIDVWIHTGYEPSEETYISVLSNIILAFDYSNATSISEQAKLDDLKGFKDYLFDAKNALVDVVGIIAGDSGLDNEVSVAIDCLSTTIDSTDRLLDAVCKLDTVIQDYSKYDLFLRIIEENSEGKLQSAAQKLRKSIKSILDVKLEAYTEVTEKNVEKFSEFFVNDLLFDIIKLGDTYEKDETVRFFIDEADKFQDVIQKGMTSLDLGFIIGKTIGNVVIGGENLIRRTLEIEALYDISVILSDRLLDLTNEAVLGTSDEKINDVVRIAQMLVGCRIRGEYCEYSIISSDAGLLSWANKKDAEEARVWYDKQCSTLLNIEKRFLGVLSAISQDSNAGSEQASEPVAETVTTVDQTETSQFPVNNGKVNYTKEWKAYQKAISKLKGKSFVLTMSADINLQANERGHREAAKENVWFSANIKNNDSKRMEMSGNCLVAAPGTYVAFNFYQQNSTAYVEYTSPRYAKVQLDSLPIDSMMNYKIEISEDDIRFAEKMENGVVLVIDGSALNLQALLKNLVSTFDSVSCDSVRIQLSTDKKGRPSKMDLFYTVEFTLGDASATAEYEQTISFSDYGNVVINKPSDSETGYREQTEDDPEPEINLDEELETISQQEDSSTDDNHTDESNDAINAYEVILDEYRRACSASIEEYRENAETEYANVNSAVMEEYHVSFHQLPGTEHEGDPDLLYELRYAYYDIDGNGIKELLITQSLQDIYLCDLYAFDAGNAVKLFSDIGEPGDLGGAVSARVNKDGIIVKQYPGDADYYRLAEDGYSLESASGIEEEDDAVQPDWQILAEDIDGGVVAGEGNSPVAVAYREKLAELSEVGASYTLFDLTGDGIEELIISVTDVEGDGGTYYFYSYQGEHLEEIGTLDGLWSVLYRSEDGGFIINWFQEETAQIDSITYDGTGIVSTRVSEFIPGEEEVDLDGNPMEEWERENASYLYEELEVWSVADTGLLDKTFGTGTEAEDSSDKPELSDYLWSIEEFHQLVGGEPSEEVGDHENWYILDGMQYGNYIDSSQVDDVVLESSEYRLFGVAIGEDADLICQRLEDDGWTVSEFYDEGYTLIKDGKNLEVTIEYGNISSVVFWNSNSEE